MLKANNYLEHLTLKHILIIALIPRLMAAIFSQGYGMSDDHFLVIEVAKAWSQGIDLGVWFTSNIDEMTSGRAIFYPGLHYILFEVLDALGISRLSSQMYVVRLLHATYALLPVYFIYHLTLLFAERKYAVIASLVWALLWFVPYMSVRNLVEMVAIPPILFGALISLRLIKNGGSPSKHLWVGILFALSFTIRYQAGLFPVGFCLGLLALKHYKEFFYSLLAGVVWLVLFHGLGDYLVSGTPFGKVIFYVEYNMNFGTTYISQPWYQYLTVIIGFLIPPLGIFWFLGMFKFKKTTLPIFLGISVFFIVHSIFDGKQERFIFTIMPFVLSLGIPGWYMLMEKYQRKWLFKLTQFSWYLAGIPNMLALILLSIWYSKSSKVKVMDHFSGTPNLTELNVLSLTNDGETLFPLAYSGQFPDIIHYTPKMLEEQAVIEEIKKSNVLIIERRPSQDMGQYLNTLKGYNIELEPIKSYSNSLVDGFHYQINPRHVSNYEYDLYKIKSAF